MIYDYPQKNRLPIGFYVTLCTMFTARPNRTVILGDLEKRVMRYLWTASHADVKDVHAKLTKEQGGALNTIQSTLDRLYRKGLLDRRKQGHAYVYCPRIGRRELIAQLIQSVAGDFLKDDEDTLAAAFSSVSTELDDDQLSRLEQLIHEQRRQRFEERRGAD